MPRYRPKARIIRTFLLVPPSSFFRPRSAMPAPYGESERCVMLEAATWNGKWRKSWFFVAPSYFFWEGEVALEEKRPFWDIRYCLFSWFALFGGFCHRCCRISVSRSGPRTSLRPRTCKPHYRTGREGSWEDGSRRVNTVPDIGA